MEVALEYNSLNTPPLMNGSVMNACCEIHRKREEEEDQLKCLNDDSAWISSAPEEEKVDFKLIVDGASVAVALGSTKELLYSEVSKY